MTSPLTILRVDASPRGSDSTSRALGDRLIARLAADMPGAEVVARDPSGLPFLDGDWVAANLTPEESRTGAQRDALALSDALVAELFAADVLVVTTPIYNLGVPAALKAWIDLIVRARLTFRYSDKGAEGLLAGRRAYVVVTTGGMTVGSRSDHASGQVRDVLAFLGMDVEVIPAEHIGRKNDGRGAAEARIDQLALAARAPAAAAE